MQIVNEEETIQWLANKGLIDSRGMFSFSGFAKVMESAIPRDSGRKTALSRAIISYFKTDDQALLWINEFGIWPSSEDWNLFDKFRQSLGERSPLHEKPGHIFSNSDLSDIGSLVTMMLYFAWGGILYSPVMGLAIKISHDEYISVFVRNKEYASDISDELKKYFDPGGK